MEVEVEVEVGAVEERKRSGRAKRSLVVRALIPRPDRRPVQVQVQVQVGTDTAKGISRNTRSIAVNQFPLLLPLPPVLSLSII